MDAADEALLAALSEMSDDDVRALAAWRWSTCKTASLLLALLDRLAPREILVSAALACARHALPARSTPEPALAQALAAAATGPDAAQRAARAAYNHVSRQVAGVDDDVALAVAEACDLAAGDPYDGGSPDPAARAAWAWAWRRSGTGARRDAVESMDAQVQGELADVVRAVVSARRTPPSNGSGERDSCGRDGLGEPEQGGPGAPASTPRPERGGGVQRGRREVCVRHRGWRLVAEHRRGRGFLRRRVAGASRVGYGRA